MKNTSGISVYSKLFPILLLYECNDTEPLGPLCPTILALWMKIHKYFGDMTTGRGKPMYSAKAVPVSLCPGVTLL
jgi:hypothetical protein